MDDKTLRSNLVELLAQWKETVSLYNSDPSMRQAASGVVECMNELREILDGDLSAIEKW